ncbi:hypothetical protein O980_08770 [Mycobacterium avium subsp. paratuberculosis 08-8281]|nr:hypothetical protein O980_08770 [Mycobacterium avium subsp. paratuberculosis 08-8281]ETB33213.1 hypothetical protein O977_09735 [Mycobacterium avium subsp. paratuberculosis 10-5975]
MNASHAFGWIFSAGVGVAVVVGFATLDGICTVREGGNDSFTPSDLWLTCSPIM